MHAGISKEKEASSFKEGIRIRLAWYVERLGIFILLQS